MFYLPHAGKNYLTQVSGRGSKFFGEKLEVGTREILELDSKLFDLFS